MIFWGKRGPIPTFEAKLPTADNSFASKKPIQPPLPQKAKRPIPTRISGTPRFVDQALKQFAQQDAQPDISFEEHFSEVDERGDHEGTINHSLSAQSLYLLHQIAKLGIYGETTGEVGERLVDLALQGLVVRPQFGIAPKQSK